MINFTVLNSSADAKRYYSPHGHDYWIEDRDQLAFFGGRLAERLGIKDFDLATFHELCEGVVPGTSRYDRKTGDRIPDSGDQLTPGKKENKRAGYDVTLDGPKDLGVLMALGLDERIIPEVLQRAGRDVMALIERDAKTRVRVGRQDTDRPTGEIVYTGVLHTTARPVGDKIDVQPHFHMLVANATWDPVEHRYKALQLQPWAANGAKEARPYYTAYFNSQLARYMQGLGYRIEATKDSFRVVGVPDRVRREFSQRTQKIEAVAAKLEKQKQEFLGDPSATLNPEVKGRLGAHTRERKQPGKTWDSLLEHWNSRVTDAEQQAVLNTVIRSHRQPVERELANADALDWAIRHAFERSSVVTERELVTHALRHGLGSVTAEGIHAELGKRSDLIRRRVDGRDLVTTKSVLAEERKIVAFAQKGRGRFRPLQSTAGDGRVITADKTTGYDPASVATPAAGTDLTTLSPSQQAAIRHVWHSRDPLMLVRGAAGTGKTTMTRAMLAGVDVPWVILAPSAQASRGVLRSEGFGEQADTLAKFLLDEEFQEKARGGLIVLDEASMSGAHDLARLIQVADSLHARVLLLGDRRQHKSVARGDVLALLEDKAGLPVAEVAEIKRQAGEYKAAVKLASEGRVSEAFGKLDKLGWVREGGLVDDYMAAVKDGKSVLVVSPTHAQGDKVTAAIRERLKQERRLTGEERAFDTLVPLQWTAAERGLPGNYQPGDVLQFHRASGSGVKAGDRRVVEAGEDNARVTRPAEGAARSGSDRDQVLLEDHCRNPAVFGAYRPAVLGISAGDAIRITANGKTLDGKHRLNNGAVYTVDDFTDDGNIRLNNGWVLSKGYGHLAHGYVSTSHASQGRTVDRVLIDMPVATFPAVGKEQFYVSVSRGKQQARVYTDDREALRDAIEREDTRLLASELVKAPRKNILKQLKRRVSFLRDLAAHTKVRVHEIIRPRVREMHHER